MTVVLKESLLTPEFKFHNEVNKDNQRKNTVLILCKNSNGFFINVEQLKNDETVEWTTLIAGIGNYKEAVTIFKEIDSVLAEKGFGLSYTEEQKFLEKQESKENSQSNMQKKSQKEELVESLVNELDDELDSIFDDDEE